MHANLHSALHKGMTRNKERTQFFNCAFVYFKHNKESKNCSNVITMCDKGLKIGITSTTMIHIKTKAGSILKTLYFHLHS